MSAMARERKTYRGTTLEELLPQIREDLGATAVITRRREGVVGGIGGFFGKKCVEVEAEGPALRADLVDDDLSAAPVAPVLPPRFAVDAYDTGADGDSAVSPLLRELRDQAAPFLLEDDADEAEPETPFADLLAAAAAAPEPEPQPEVEAQPFLRHWIPAEPELAPLDETAQAPAPAPAPAAAAAPAPLPEPAVPDWRKKLEWLASYEAGRAASSPAAAELEPAPAAEPQLVPATPRASWSPRAKGDIRIALASAGFAEEMTAALMREVEVHVRSFAPFEDPRSQARRVLARNLAVRHGWKTKRRTIAVLGAANVGRTAVVARLCHAYAGRAGLDAAAVSLEPVRAALRLGTLVDPLAIELAVADSAEQAAALAKGLRRADVVLVDTPPLDGARAELDQLAEVLAALKPDEIHVAVSAAAPASEVVRQLALARRVGKVDAIILTRLDQAYGAPDALAIAAAERIPFSFVSRGDRPDSGVLPAESQKLAELVL
jgi:flagellar biosynthesis protein FlhF